MIIINSHRTQFIWDQGLKWSNIGISKIKVIKISIDLTFQKLKWLGLYNPYYGSITSKSYHSYLKTTYWAVGIWLRNST